MSFSDNPSPTCEPRAKWKPNMPYLQKAEPANTWVSVCSCRVGAFYEVMLMGYRKEVLLLHTSSRGMSSFRPPEPALGSETGEPDRLSRPDTSCSHTHWDTECTLKVTHPVDSCTESYKSTYQMLISTQKWCVSNVKDNNRSISGIHFNSSPHTHTRTSSHMLSHFHQKQQVKQSGYRLPV